MNPDTDILDMSREEFMLQIARALFSDDDGWCPGPTYRQQWNNPPTEEELDAWVRGNNTTLWMGR